MASGIYHGDSAGVAASPYGATQLAQRNYLAAEPGSAVTFTFSAPQTQFQLLWGTIDSYNSLVFTRTDGTSLTISGNDILAADGGASSAFVTISDVGSFRNVTARSASPAFEFVPGFRHRGPGASLPRNRRGRSRRPALGAPPLLPTSRSAVCTLRSASTLSMLARCKPRPEGGLGAG